MEETTHRAQVLAQHAAQYAAQSPAQCTAGPTGAGHAPEPAPEHGEATAPSQALGQSQRGRQRPKRRQLFCPAHPQQRIGGTGKKYYLHVLSAEELRARGMPDKKARLVIQAYPVLVLGNEWLEELFCPACGTSRWCHVSKGAEGNLLVRWAQRELWQQVAHVDPLQPNPTVSEFTRRQARRLRNRRVDGRQLFERL